MRLEWMAPSMWRVLKRLLFVVLGYLPGSSTSWTGEQALVYPASACYSWRRVGWLSATATKKDADHGDLQRRGLAAHLATV